MRARLLVAFLSLALLAACNTPQVAISAAQPRAGGPVAAAQQPATAEPRQEPKAAEEPRAEPAKDPKQLAEERAAKEKELRSKRRELERLFAEHRIAALDRDMRELSVAAARQRAAEDLEAARRELAHFEGAERPRELDEWQIRIDRSTYHAEQAKGELDELIAMYEADEFAKATKELVILRGRRQLEMAERELANTKKEFAEFREFALPNREREHRRKVADAEREVHKAEREAEKAGLERELQLQKEQDRVRDLEEEIAELAKKLAEAAS